MSLLSILNYLCFALAGSQVLGSSSIQHKVNLSSTPFVNRQLFLDGFGILRNRRRCKKGTVYRITSIEDLQEKRDELECILVGGLEPTEVFRGRLYGDVLKLFGSTSFSVFGNLVWQGKLVTDVNCGQSASTVLGLNYVKGLLGFPFEITIGPITFPLRSGEYNDGRNFLIFDYTKDFNEMCQQKNMMSTADTVMKNFSRIEVEIQVINPFPMNIVHDVMRFVGRSADNGAIYLGKGLADVNGGSSTVVYFTGISNDETVHPEFRPLQALPPLEEDFEYRGY